MLTASQIIYRLKGSPSVPDSYDVEANTRCWVCAAQTSRAVPRSKWMGANFTDQNRIRCYASEWVCAACVHVMAGKPPDTERMWSHLVDGDDYTRENKGGKAAMRAFLRRKKAGVWLAAIADSGKKHVIPWTPVNLPGRDGGLVMFEDRRVALPGSESGWQIVDDMAHVLTLGASKEGLERGEHSPFAWERCPVELRQFEATWGQLRGGAWFTLALWLAQRDEEAVQARLEEEKAARAAQKEAERARRKGERGAAKPKRRGAARDPSGVPGDAGMQRAEALGQAAEHDAGERSNDCERRGVGNADAKEAAAVGTQLQLLGDDPPAGRPRARARKA